MVRLESWNGPLLSPSVPVEQSLLPGSEKSLRSEARRQGRLVLFLWTLTLQFRKSLQLRCKGLVQEKQRQEREKQCKGVSSCLAGFLGISEGTVYHLFSGKVSQGRGWEVIQTHRLFPSYATWFSQRNYNVATAVIVIEKLRCIDFNLSYNERERREIILMLVNAGGN